MGELRKLEKCLRPISIFDIVRSKMFKSPSTFSCFYNEPLSESISSFLDSGVEIHKIDQHHMTLINSKGSSFEFWVANYPYSYGSVNGHTCKYPSWEVVLKLRRIQLTKRKYVIDKFIEENTL